MRNVIIGAVIACVLSASAGAAVTARLYKPRPGDSLAIGTVALRCKVGSAQIRCVDTRRRSKRVSVSMNRTELFIRRGPRQVLITKLRR